MKIKKTNPTKKRILSLITYTMLFIEPCLARAEMSWILWDHEIIGYSAGIARPSRQTWTVGDAYDTRALCLQVRDKIVKRADKEGQAAKEKMARKKENVMGEEMTKEEEMALKKEFVNMNNIEELSKEDLMALRKELARREEMARKARTPDFILVEGSMILRDGGSSGIIANEYTCFPSTIDPSLRR